MAAAKSETTAENTPNDQAKPAGIQFITMVRNDSYPAPHQAKVHPDEVKNYYSGGWVEKKEEAK